MSFNFEDLNEKLFDKVIAYSYSIGSGLGGPGAICLLTEDGKEYYIGQDGFEGDWIYPEKYFPFMKDTSSDEGGKWFCSIKEYAPEEIRCRKDLKSYSTIEKRFKENKKIDSWQDVVWQAMGIERNDVEYIMYDKTKENRKKHEEEWKMSEEHFNRVIIKPDTYEWRKLYWNNAIPKDDSDDSWLLQGYYLLLFKRTDEGCINGAMMTIAFQREEEKEGEHSMDAKIEAYNLFWQTFEDVRGTLEIPKYQGQSATKELESTFGGRLSCYCVNNRDNFIRTYFTLDEAKRAAMYWLMVKCGINIENVIPYGADRNDFDITRKKERHEAELLLRFTERYGEVIETIKKYDYLGNAADEVARILDIDREEVRFIYHMFNPMLFTTTRRQTLKKTIGEEICEIQ